MSQPTLLDIAKHTADDAMIPLIEQSVESNPELRVIPAMDIPGQSFKCLLRTSVPTGGFRNANEGTTAVKSTWANKLIETFILDRAIEVDKAVADTHPKGAEYYIALEGAGLLEGQFRAACSQFYYGTASDVAASAASNASKGFPGLLELYDSTNMVVDAGGSGADCSSAWLLATGDRFVQWIIGNGGAMTLGELQEDVRLTDDDSLPYNGYRQPMLAYLGAQLINPNSMARIKNIEPDNKLTDDDIYAALELFPTGIVPNVIFMTRRSRGYLRQGRTATNATGAPAPIPSEFEGIPIEVTDAISDAETND